MTTIYILAGVDDFEETIYPECAFWDKKKAEE